MIRWLGVFAFSAISLVSQAQNLAGQDDEVAPRYTVHDLGGPNSFVTALSSNGRTAGYFNGPVIFRANLPPLRVRVPGTGQITGINATGTVVGSFYENSEEFGSRAFLWRNGALTVLPSMGPGSTVATAINDASQVVGWFHAANGAKHAFLYQNGVAKDLGTWGGDAAYATAINRNGDIAGTRVIGGVKQAAKIYRGKLEIVHNILNAASSEATSINVNGDIAGYRVLWPTAGGFTGMQAFAVVGTSVRRIASNAPPYPGAIASINDKRQMVGQFTIMDGAFFWERGKLLLLNTLPEVRAGTPPRGLYETVGINQSGTIAGNMHEYDPALGMFHRAVKLVPVTPD